MNIFVGLSNTNPKASKTLLQVNTFDTIKPLD